MTKPWEMTADELEAWAAHASAPAVLPRLVRRLLLATEPVDAIDMRADAGTRLPGWDGVVRARDEGLYCPAGVSVWEMSTEARVRAKLNEDFEKRTAAPGMVRPPLSTYVAVTARRLKGKEEWVDDKKAARRWADVRLLDADDLASWLEQAPGVAVWFAEHLGKQTGASELAAFVQRWQDRTAPPLPSSLVLAGSEREKQADWLRDWAQRSSGLPLFVQAEAQEEAALFAAVALAADDAPRDLAERALVVESADTFAWLLRPRRSGHLLLIAAFENPEIARAKAVKVPLIVPVDSAASPPREQTLRLDRQPYPRLARKLEDHGWEKHQAERLVQQAGGSLTALQHLCGYFVPPAWARDVPQAELIAFLLMGAWTPASEADREAVRRLGADPARLERWCAASMHGPWVEQGHDRGHSPFFRWRALPGAWKTLGPALAGLQSWNRAFYELARDVIGEDNPAFDLPREQRFSAAMYGKVLRFSGALREGIAISLIQLALSLDIPDGGSWAAAVVRDVLDKKRGWKIWASLDRLLPLLAEAAPDAFLKALDESLDIGESGVVHLFADEGRAGFFGEVMHTGLLWALERLAWLQDYGIIQRAVLALARLAEVDRDGQKPGKVSNRPLASLEAVLDAAAPQSSTTVEQRLNLLRLLCQRHADVAWKVLNGSFGLLWMPRMLHQGNAPSHRPGGPRGDFNQATGEELSEQLRSTIALWMEHAGTDAERWASALEPARHFGEPEGTQVLDTLAERAEQIRDPQAKVWAALRSRLDLFFRSDDQPETERKKLEELYKRFEPADVVLRVGWLFGQGPELPEPLEGDASDRWKASHTRLQELRREAVTEIYPSPDAWTTFSRLSESVEIPGILGEALAQASFGAALDERLLNGPDAGPLGRAVPWFFAARAYQQGYGSGQMEWVARTLRRLTDVGRIQEAAQGAAVLPPHKGLWDFLDEAGDPLKSAYWKSIRYVFGEHSAGELARALRELVGVGRAQLAVDVASAQQKLISGELARFLLESLRDQWARREEEKHSNSMLGYSVRSMFEVLDRDPPEDLEVVAGLEIRFLPLLEDHSDRPRRPLVLGRMLASSPEMFVQLLARRYRPRGAPSGEAVTPEERNAAENVYELFHAWDGTPGEGLDEDAREKAIEDWCHAVFDLASKQGRGEISVVEIANVLARAPVPADGHWPCLAARRLLEQRALPELERHLRISEYNQRNGRLRPVSSEREHGVAEDFKASAQALRDDFPRTAWMLDEIAQEYERNAEQWEIREREEKILYGDSDEPVQPAPPTGADPTPVSGPVRLLETRHVGPAATLALDLAPRLSLLTGDNSLGKTFVLDVLFWALTGTWPPGHAMARPEPPKRTQVRRSKSNGAATTPRIVAQADDRSLVGTYDFKRARWTTTGAGALRSGLVVYARVDGGFSVYDPLRNAEPPDGSPNAWPCFHFGRQFNPRMSAAAQDSGDTLWEGLREPNQKPVCNGLIADAVQWRDRNGQAFSRLKEALKRLSPPEEEPIQFDLPRRFPGESRDHPRLKMPYGTIYAVHASAAVKRALGLAYALVWAVVEAKEAADQRGVEPPSRLILLIDEIESHLHPRWQRTILGAVLEAARGLLPQRAEVQVVATTHSALVIASAEPLFEPEKDALFHFQTAGVDATVTVGRVPFQRRGEADAWLTSPLFGLSSTRSVKAEELLQRAAEAMKNGGVAPAEAREINRELERELSDLDPFWMRWRYIAEKRGWLK